MYRILRQESASRRRGVDEVLQNKRAEDTVCNGGGFFLACQDFEGRFDKSFPACGFIF